MHSFFTPKILKINITINLTHTNKKSTVVQVLELIKPEKDVPKEMLAYNARNPSLFEFSNSNDILSTLKDINKCINSHEENTSTFVSAVNITINAPDTLPITVSDEKLRLTRVYDFILTQQQPIEEIDKKIQKYMCLVM